jgi:hypothetical protein
MPLASFTVHLNPEDAALVMRALKGIMREIRKRDVDLDAGTIAERMVDAVNAGEREYTRLLALAMGPEGAREWRAN